MKKNKWVLLLIAFVAFLVLVYGTGELVYTKAQKTKKKQIDQSKL